MSEPMTREKFEVAVADVFRRGPVAARLAADHLLAHDAALRARLAEAEAAAGKWEAALAAQCRLSCSDCASGFPVEYDAEDGRWWHQLPHGEGDVECMADPLREVARALLAPERPA